MNIIKYTISGDYIELCQLLKVTGLCGSGGQAKQAISELLVKVDNKIEIRKKCKVSRGQKVTYDNQTVLVE
ncbi:MAG: RNA-binding S4 domain-containing protein [Candidatus Margulisbacteria bacterium]|nr:RNA-binding S4 domain-containing protein [Candidatus Margulisiibacteriota bacterium]